MKRLKFCFSLILVFAVFFLSTRESWSAFRLTLTPFEGGYDLRFGRISVGDPKEVKELTITVTTDIGKQYRIFQRVDAPLTTADRYDIDRNQFKMYTLLNSNNRGTLERLEEFPVRYSDTLLYTSNPAGEGDSFKVVYTIEPFASQAPGHYSGRLLFILRPINSTQEQDTETINMYVDLSNEGAIEISTESGFNSIRISSKDLDDIKHDYPSVFIDIKGNLGAPYRIYQQLGDSLIRSINDDQFDLSKVIYYVLENDTATPLKEGNLSDLKSKSLIYASDNLGSGDQLSVTYEPTSVFPLEKAGTYSGVINFIVEMDRQVGSVDPGLAGSVSVDFDVEKIFRLVVSSVLEGEEVVKEGGPLLSFGKVNYKSGVKESKVQIKIETNAKEPYMVSQKLSAPLRNEEGVKIPEKLFTFVLSKEEDTGAFLKFDGETIVDSEKDTPVFISNSKGESDKLEITYKLKTTPDTRGGNYNTGISYSLSEL